MITNKSMCMTMGVALTALIACGGQNDGTTAGTGSPQGGNGAGGEAIGVGGSGGSAVTASGSGGSGAGSGGGATQATSAHIQVQIEGGPGKLPGVSVCIHGTDICGESDPEGWLTLELPADIVDLAFAIDHPALYPTLVPYRIQKEGDYHVIAFSRTETETGAAELGLSLDPDKALLVQGLDAPGSSVSIDPASGLGPLYSFADPGATTVVEGFYVFANVDPGEVLVTIHDAEGTCDLHAHWAGSEPNTLRAPLVAGRMTFLRFMGCSDTEL